MNTETERAEHTAGPWKVERRIHGDAKAMIFAGRRPEAVAAVYSEKDARLIAAAPELLSAAKAMVKAEVGSITEAKAYDALEAAIAKAEGADR